MSVVTRGSWGPERDTSLSDVGMPLVEIPSDIGLSLVVKWPVGFAYFNQTGGHSCLQSWAEGVLVPIPAPSSSTDDRLYEMFGPGSKYGGHCSDGIDEEDADSIDALLAVHHHAFQGERIVRVDRERLRDSWEAWVHVRIGAHPKRHPKLPLRVRERAPLGSDENAFLWPFFGLPSDRAILTWTNSD
jgi:Family of unknown function (DUF6210)